MNLITCTKCGSTKPQKFFKFVDYLSPDPPQWFGARVGTPRRVGEGLCVYCFKGGK